MNLPNVRFVDDYLSILTGDLKVFISVTSKIEYIVKQLLMDYQNNLLIDADLMKYSIIKALNTYQPREIVQCLCNTPEKFVDELKKFFRSRIDENYKNFELKKTESAAFWAILNYLEQASAVPEQHWDYHGPFEDLQKYLREERIQAYSLLLDKEGKAHEDSRTLTAAKEVGFTEATEDNSMVSCGLRMADMMAGIISKLLKALCDALTYHSSEEAIKKKILAPKWFQLNEAQLQLYKKLYRILCEWDQVPHKICTGIYTDDLVVLHALLTYMNQFDSTEQMKEKPAIMHSERFNELTVQELSDYFEIRSHKLPIESATLEKGEYYFNQRGAKVYCDMRRQPMFDVKKDNQIVEVLSVGIDRSGCPLVTIEKNGKADCYRLPQELDEWARSVVGFADMGINTFPAKVRFSKNQGRLVAEIL